MARQRPRRVALLYTSDWSGELRKHRRGEVPSHRLFGYVGLADLAFRPELVHVPRWVPERARGGIAWKVYQALWVLVRQARLSWIVATTEAPALPVLLLKSVGLVRRPVVVISVALLHPRQVSGVRGRLWRRALRSAAVVVVYSSAQRENTARSFGIPVGKVFFIPLGVDADFFAVPDGPRPPEAGSLAELRIAPDVLAVGTNEGKDYPTLVQALPAGVSCLIVTDEPNANAARAAAMPGASLAFDAAVPIARLRHLYRAASVQVIPLHDVAFSSGQTVLLENFASGTPVVTTDVAAVRDYVRPDVTAIVVPAGDAQALRSAIERVLADVELQRRLGAAAAADVRERFTENAFAARLGKLLEELEH